MSTYKICSTCREEKELSQFNKRLNSIDGLQNKCRDCSKILSKKYRENNPHISKKYNDSFSSKNPEYSKEWAKNNKERRRVQGMLWAMNNPEKRKINKQRLKKLNPHVDKDYKSKRNKFLSKSSIIKEEIRRIKIFKLQAKEGYVADHIIPLIHEKVCGLNVVSNLQYLTHKENSIKSNSFDGTKENDSWRKLLEIREMLEDNLKGNSGLKIPNISRST